MRCLNPITIRVDRYKDIHGKVQIEKNTTLYRQVPCGKCEYCYKRYISSWSYRLSLQSKTSVEALFVTLTYDDEHLPENGVSKEDIQKYHKRIRKTLNELSSDFKYMLISEYGGKFHRPHYHAIYWGVPPTVVFDKWQNGFVKISEVLPQRLAYVLSYHILKNLNVPPNMNKNFRLMSNHLGLEGFDETELANAKKNGWKYMVNEQDTIVSMPRYFRKKHGIKLGYEEPELPLRFLSKKEIVDNYNARQVHTKLYIKRKLLNKQI